MNPTEHTFGILMLDDSRRGERLNVGLVAFAPGGGVTVRIAAEPSRLRALHPDLAAFDPQAEQAALQATLDQLGDRQMQLHWLAHPPGGPQLAPEPPGTFWLREGETLAERLDEMIARLVATPARTGPARRPARKGATRLQVELRDWLRGAKLFSPRIDDLSRNRVVANYPVDVRADLYADFAFRNGVVHVMETLDLRGVAHLTPGQRGQAALKGITLDEARERLDAGAQRIAVVAATDYGVARPAIRLVERYATDVYDLGAQGERERLARFVGESLHTQQPLTAPLAG